MGDQEHDLIFGVLLQISEDDVLGIAVQRGEGVVEDQHRARMGQRSCQRQPLRLTARKAGAAGADDGLQPLLHPAHLVVQRSLSQIGFSLLFAAAEDVVLHRVGAQLRVMAQIADGGGDLPGRQCGELGPAEPGRAAVGSLTEEYAAKGGFSAGDRAGNADDIAGAGRQAQAGEDRLPAIGKGEVFQRHIRRFRDAERSQLFRLLHQGLDPRPRDFGLLHRVEELGRLRGLDHQFGEAGQEGGKGRDVPHAPPGAEDVLGTEPEDEEHARLRRRQIEGRQGRLPDVAADGGLFVGVQGVLVFFRAGVLAAVDAVSDRVLGAIQRGGAQGTGRLFIGRSGALHRLFHPRGADVGYRREEQAEQSQPPIVHQQHDRIAHQRHAGVEDLGGKFPHSLHAVVHVGDGFGHQLPGPLFFEGGAALAHQIGVEDALHPAVDVVGEPADVEPLDEPRRLHQQDDEDVGWHQHRHLCRSLAAAEDVGKALGQTALEPRRRQQTDVIHKARKGHEGQRQPLQPEVGKDPFRTEVFLRLHRWSPLLLCSRSAGSPPGSRSWRRRTAFSAPPRSPQCP